MQNIYLGALVVEFHVFTYMLVSVYEGGGSESLSMLTSTSTLMDLAIAGLLQYFFSHNSLSSIKFYCVKMAQQWLTGHPLVSVTLAWIGRHVFVGLPGQR